MLNNPYPGKFIVLEGIDGAGKSTQGAALAKYFREQKIKSYFTSEPTDSPVGVLIRKHLVKKWRISPDCLELLFAADRANHLDQEITPKLKKNFAVVCDRYLFSSLAYGSFNLDFDWILELNKNFILPDLVLYLEVAPRAGVKRIKNEGRSADLYEKTGKLDRVAKNYVKMFKNFPFGDMAVEFIDANGAAKKITENIIKSINKTLVL